MPINRKYLMSSAETRSSLEIPPPSFPEAEAPGAAQENRNMLVLVVHQVLIRVGWIFKTESVLMPSFLDLIAGAGWVRGCLPVLNRLGQSIPQFLFADRLRASSLKRWPLFLATVMMGVPFLILAGLLTISGAVGSLWLPVVFLVLYLFFFSMTGLNQLALGTITGKLIRVTRRGRLSAMSGVVGVSLAIFAAWSLLPGWLSRENGGFVMIFSFVGTFFCLAAGAGLFVAEDADDYPHRRREQPFRDAARRVRTDPHLLRLLVVSVLFVSALLLVPHYQALARGDGRTDFSQLMVWVVSQNASAGVMAVISGFIADRFGNRLALRLLILLAASTPLVAIGLSTWVEKRWFVLTFVVFGSLPNTFRILTNYCLELTTPDRHAQYISTLKLFMPITLLLAPVVGLIIDGVGFAPVFLTIAAVNMAGFVMTFFIAEPRHWPAGAEKSL